MGIAVKKKKPTSKSIGKANLYVITTFNNTIVTLTTASGDTIAWKSGGTTQKGARKATAHAAKEAAVELGRIAKDRGVTSVVVYLRGTGNGRDTAIQGFASGAHNVSIAAIHDITRSAHAGCRRRKKKRV